MNLSVTFRHMEATEAIKDYTRDKVERILKYFKSPINGHVVLSTERGYHHVADINIKLPNGIALKGKESTEDMYSSIDLAMAKIERQVRRYKDRIRDHKPHAGPELAIRQFVFEAESMESAAMSGTEAAPAPSPKGRAKEQAEATAQPSDGSSVQVVKSSKFFARPMSVEEAVMQMNLLNNEFLVFMNSSSKQVNVVYRRKDGNYGLIETGANG